MLELYAARFPIVEIDATYSRVPPASTFALMVRLLRATVVPRSMTRRMRMTNA